MVNCYLSGNPVHDMVIKSFYEGCKAEKQLLRFEEYKPSEIAVVFGVFKSKVPASYPRGYVISEQRKNNLDVIVLETGYINRGDGHNHHYAAGYNGLNGRADFRNANSPPDRSLGVLLNPWKSGENILLCGQVPWDASVEGTDHIQWLMDAAKSIRYYTDRPIVFRSHPLCNVGSIPGATKSTASLKEELEQAFAVVTFNSNCGVDAALAGVPVFAFDEGSMVWNIANRFWENLEKPVHQDRGQWLNDICYAQWTPQEMQNGDTWTHLSR